MPNGDDLIKAEEAVLEAARELGTTNVAILIVLAIGVLIVLAFIMTAYKFGTPLMGMMKDFIGNMQKSNAAMQATNEALSRNSEALLTAVEANNERLKQSVEAERQTQVALAAQQATDEKIAAALNTLQTVAEGNATMVKATLGEVTTIAQTQAQLVDELRPAIDEWRAFAMTAKDLRAVGQNLVEVSNAMDERLSQHITAVMGVIESIKPQRLEPVSVTEVSVNGG